MAYNINIYSDRIISEADGQTQNVYLTNVDVTQVIAEFSPKDVLDCLELSQIVDYVAEMNEERDE
jgi:hypothetical protein